MKKLMIALAISALGIFAYSQEAGTAPATAPAAPSIEAPAPDAVIVTPSAEASSAGGEAAAPAADKASEAKKAPRQSGGGFGMFLPMLIILAIFYFMMIRPQQRKEKERRKMIDELKAGAKIIFSGGIIGTIVEAGEKTFKVETAPGTEMEVLRSAVQGSVQ